MFTKNLILVTKEKYLDFISSWPQRFRYKGKNFKELFTFNRDFSLWWLTEMQKKDPEISSVFENLCRLESGLKPKKMPRGFKSSSLGHVFSRFYFLCRIFIKMTIFRLFFRKEIISDEKVVLFASLYLQTLKDRNGKLRDRYYLDLPDALTKDCGFTVRYVSFYYGSVIRLLGEIPQAKKNRIIFCENYLRFSDLFRAWDIKTIARFIFLKKKEGFQDSFNFNGHDISASFKSELSGSLIGRGCAEWVLLSIAMERIARKYQPKGIISFLEMYPYSRALYYGVKKGYPAIKTFAYQHANISPLKLWYTYRPDELSFENSFINGMPIPDYFLFSGKMGKQILMDSGYPEERCFLAGSLRSDRFFYLRKEQVMTPLSKEGKNILVATTYSKPDTERLIGIINEAAKKRSDDLFIIKAHPQFPVNKILAHNGPKNIVLSYDDTYQLVQRVDCLLTSYSTVADEAIALSCPVICIDTGALIDMSSFFTIAAAPVVTTALALDSWLEKLFYHPEEFRRFKEKWPVLIEASFYKLDGRAKERCKDFIRQNL